VSSELLVVVPLGDDPEWFSFLSLGIGDAAGIFSEVGGAATSRDVHVDCLLGHTWEGRILSIHKISTR
jgi:hypothetical protein